MRKKKMMEEKRDERRMKKGEILLKARLQMSEESFEGHVIQKKYRQTGEMTKCLCAEQYVCIDIFPRHLGYFLYPFCLPFPFLFLFFCFFYFYFFFVEGDIGNIDGRVPLNNPDLLVDLLHAHARYLLPFY